MPPNSPYYGTGYNDIYNTILNGDPKDWNDQNTRSKLDLYGSDFVQQFQNAVGRPPDANEINAFYQQAVAPVANTPSGYYGTDPNAVVQQYIPQAYASQIKQNNQNQLPDLAKQISSLGTSVGQNTATQLADPNNPIYQAFSGQMNNLGISPSSGAFQAGIGSTIGNAISGAESQGLQSLGMGAIGGNQSPTYQSLLGMGGQAGESMMSRNNNLMDFQLQSSLANKLAQMSQPSQFATDFGMATSGLSAGGNALLGASAAKKSGLTWICTAMNNSGVMSKTEIEGLHTHLYKAFWKRPFKFIVYILFGKLLVLLAEKVNTDWRVWKSQFYDRVIEEADSARAVDLYEEAFLNLFRIIRSRFVLEVIHGTR